jgi:hypothetical protein
LEKDTAEFAGPVFFFDIYGKVCREAVQQMYIMLECFIRQYNLNTLRSIVPYRDVESWSGLS